MKWSLLNSERTLAKLEQEEEGRSVLRCPLDLQDVTSDLILHCINNFTRFLHIIQLNTGLWKRFPDYSNSAVEVFSPKLIPPASLLNFRFLHGGAAEGCSAPAGRRRWTGSPSPEKAWRRSAPAAPAVTRLSPRMLLASSVRTVSAGWISPIRGKIASRFRLLLMRVRPAAPRSGFESRSKVSFCKRRYLLGCCRPAPNDRQRTSGGLRGSSCSIWSTRWGGGHGRSPERSHSSQ